MPFETILLINSGNCKTETISEIVPHPLHLLQELNLIDSGDNKAKLTSEFVADVKFLIAESMVSMCCVHPAYATA